MLEKLSSYNLLNYLVPGVITVLVVSKTTHFNLIQQDIWLGAFFLLFCRNASESIWVTNY